jgi:hypothetical protein
MVQQAVAGISVITCVYCICYLTADAPICQWREALRLIARTLAILGLDLLLSALTGRPVSLAEASVVSALCLSLFTSFRLLSYYRVFHES